MKRWGCCCLCNGSSGTAHHERLYSFNIESLVRTYVLIVLRTEGFRSDDGCKYASNFTQMLSSFINYTGHRLRKPARIHTKLVFQGTGLAIVCFFLKTFQAFRSGYSPHRDRCSQLESFLGG